MATIPERLLALAMRMQRESDDTIVAKLAEGWDGWDHVRADPGGEIDNHWHVADPRLVRDISQLATCDYFQGSPPRKDHLLEAVIEGLDCPMASSSNGDTHRARSSVAWPSGLPRGAEPDVAPLECPSVVSTCSRPR